MHIFNFLLKEKYGSEIRSIANEAFQNINQILRNRNLLLETKEKDAEQLFNIHRPIEQWMLRNFLADEEET